MVDINTIYKDLPHRMRVGDNEARNKMVEFGLDLSGLPKWRIPEKVCVTAQPVGMPVMRRQNPNQPYTTAEILRSCLECIHAGATSLHIHVRTEDGKPVEDAQTRIKMMHQIVDPIREMYGYSVMIDGSECTLESFEEEKVLIDADLSEIVPVNMGHMTPDRLAQAEAYYIESKGVKPGIAVHGLEDIEQAKKCLIDTNIIRKPIYWGILPCVFGGVPLDDPIAMAEYMAKVVKRIEEIEPDYFISVPTPGRASTYLATMGILMGLGIRVGMEDTYYKWPHKDDIIDNCGKMVADVIGIAKALGRQVATADESRIFLGLPPKMKKE
ncbi:MAG: 3-keto-5-aminohexanoate cleavage protein [Dehalococcoidales bacterium]|nr:3-keto-5-aminohexanoate cleavage protein [Dehalococcoidales bacterium]